MSYTRTKLLSTEEHIRLSFGDYGFNILSATGTATSTAGDYFGIIYVTADADLSFTNDTNTGDTSITNLVLTAGMVIYGNFTSITVNSGDIIAYRRP